VAGGEKESGRKNSGKERSPLGVGGGIWNKKKEKRAIFKIPDISPRRRKKKSHKGVQTGSAKGNQEKKLKKERKSTKKNQAYLRTVLRVRQEAVGSWLVYRL
jgi:hypothetical protein